MTGIKNVLLIVDMTNDFLYREYNEGLALERGQELIPRIRRLEEKFMELGLPVIYITDRHMPGDYELAKWGPHSMKGSKGSEIAPGLVTEGMKILERRWRIEDLDDVEDRRPRLFEVEKGSYSGFTDNGGTPTALHALLNRLGIHPGDRLFITGLHTNACDKHTAADAWFRGYRPAIVSDCTDAFDDPEGLLGMGHDRALNYEKYWYDAEIMDSSQVERKLVAGKS